MSNTLCLMLILPEFADWEAASLAPILTNPHAGWQVKYVSLTEEPVKSIGGMTIIPDCSLDSAPEEFGGLVLVGGNSWRTAAAEKAMTLVNRALALHVPVGAICDATVFLGAHGVLNHVRHTSNVLDSLKEFAGDQYTNESGYVTEQAVRDGNIVTANGSAPFEFARLMLLALGVMPEKDADNLYFFLKNGLYETMANHIDLSFIL